MVCALGILIIEAAIWIFLGSWPENPSNHFMLLINNAPAINSPPGVFIIIRRVLLAVVHTCEFLNLF